MTPHAPGTQPQPRNLVPRIFALDRRIRDADALVTRARSAVATWQAVVDLAPPAPHPAGAQALASLAKALGRLRDARRARRLLRTARTRALRQSPTALAARAPTPEGATSTLKLASKVSA